MMVTIPLVKKDSVVNRAYKFEENPFTEVYIDVNYKCNMSCPMCYSDTPLGAQATVPDLDLDYYEEFCAKLPQPIIIPMVGGEPTISKHILKIYDYYSIKNFLICTGYKNHLINNFFLKKFNCKILSKKITT